MRNRISGAEMPTIIEKAMRNMHEETGKICFKASDFSAQNLALYNPDACFPRWRERSALGRIATNFGILRSDMPPLPRGGIHAASIVNALHSLVDEDRIISSPGIPNSDHESFRRPMYILK